MRARIINRSCFTGFGTKVNIYTRQYANTTIRPPTQDQIKSLCDTLGYKFDNSELSSLQTLIDSSLTPYRELSELPEYQPESKRVKYPRTPGYQPLPSENPLNAWYIKTDVHGANQGKLKGRTVVLKDNVCLAGVPMMNGSRVLEGYTPEMDATIVERILDAGGIIKGKAHNEDLCLSGGSHTNARNAVKNPKFPNHSAGGSSSGSAALVANNEVDMAIAGDQGGSIRIPSSFCGTYGMKPTWGLVPYTGVVGIEYTIDHVGPITNNTLDNAIFLEVLAGKDGFDSRQDRIPRKTFKYVSRMKVTENGGKGSVQDLKIGILKEGLGIGLNEDVKLRFDESAQLFTKLGAKVEEVSVPSHLLGKSIWSSICLEGFTSQMLTVVPPYGTGVKDLYFTSLVTAMRSGLKERANEVSDTVKISALVGRYMLDQYGGHYYAKARNWAIKLKEDYDKALEQYDVLILPTLPITASSLPSTELTAENRLTWIHSAFEMIANTTPSDLTGHPAMSIPCGNDKDGKPVGLMIVGKDFDEATIYQAAYAFEKAFNQ